MKTSWLQQEAAGCSHLPFQEPTKLVTGFHRCSLLGNCFPLHRAEREKWEWGWGKGGGRAVGGRGLGDPVLSCCK